jgi:KaiC domain protein, PAE1156 family
MNSVKIERLSTGIPDLDKLLLGGIPRGFLVALTGEPGTGKTIACIHFIAQGIKENDKCIYVTTEESEESIIVQASQFNFDFKKAMQENKLIIIDALLGGEKEWTLKSLDLDELVSKVIDAKKKIGYGRGRLVIDSLSAFWLDKPAMSRRFTYFLKKVLSKWDFTTYATSQYAITTSEAFGFGAEHIADGIIRFRRLMREGRINRYLIIEKMRQTEHSLYMQQFEIIDNVGIVIIGQAEERKEDYALPQSVKRKVLEVQKEREKEL